MQQSEKNFGKRPVHTLAQNGTKKEIVITGKGTDLNNSKALQGRAKRKLISQNIILKLIDLVKQNEELYKTSSLWNTYHCQKKLISSNGRLYGRYCKNRFCPICSSIRKADIINRYMPDIEKWEEPHFITLTLKACKANQLKSRIAGILRGFKKVKERQKKKYQRGTGIKLIGIKSLECNFNPAKKTYNPHLHLLVPNKKTAEVIIDEWLRIATPQFALRKAQHMQKVKNLESGLVEIVKYSTKIFTEPDTIKKTKNTSPDIYIAAYSNILVAMKGKRIFDRFGFNTTSKKIKHERTEQITSDYKEWEYTVKEQDWIDTSTQENLTGYKAPSQLNAILQNNINTDTK